MFRTCRAPGCSARAASRFAAHCPSHRTALRRHGAVDQKAVTKAQLKPYLTRVQASISKNPESIAWATLDERWCALVAHARSVLAYFALGKAGSCYERLAAQEVVKLAQAMEPREIVGVTAAMVLMLAQEPSRFHSDRAFWLQLARRARGLTNIQMGESWDNARQRVRRCYRELNPRAALILGQWLATTLGIGGQCVARMEETTTAKPEQAEPRAASAIVEAFPAAR